MPRSRIRGGVRRGDLSFTRAEFLDTQQPIEIEVGLSDFTVFQRGLYGDYIRFGPPAAFVVGVRAIWNDAAEENYGRLALAASRRFVMPMNVSI